MKRAESRIFESRLTFYKGHLSTSFPISHPLSFLYRYHHREVSGAVLNFESYSLYVQLPRGSRGLSVRFAVHKYFHSIVMLVDLQ